MSTSVVSAFVRQRVRSVRVFGEHAIVRPLLAMVACDHPTRPAGAAG